MSRAKSKRKIRQSKPKQPDNSNNLVLPEITREVVVYDGGEFANVDEYAEGVADERQLRLLMRDWRRGRATKTFWDVLTSGYNAIFSIVVIGAMVVGGIIGAQQESAGCSTAGCDNAKTWVPWLMIALAALAAISIAKLFGPVLASSAEGFWLFAAPTNRAVWLRPRLTKYLVAAFLAAGALTYVVMLLIGLSFTLAAWWALAAAVIATAALALVAAAQGNATTLAANLAQAIVTIVSVAILMLLVCVSVQWMSFTVKPNIHAALVIILVAAIAGIVLSVLAYSRLNALPRTRLTSGSDLANAMQGAAFALDFNLMRDILTDRKYRAVGHVRSRRGGRVGSAALISRDFQRLVRNPIKVIVILLTLVLPFATQALGLGVWGSLVSSLVLLFVFVPLFDSLRVLSRHKGLARTLPFSTKDIRLATSVVPGIVAIIWSLLACPAYLIGVDVLSVQTVGNAILVSLVTGITGFLAAMRWVSSKPPDYSAPLMSTNAGAIPPQLIFNLFRGFDIVIIAVLARVLGLNPFIELVALMVMYIIMRQGSDMSREEMMEASQEARKQAELARNGSGKRKVVTRSARR